MSAQCQPNVRPMSAQCQPEQIFSLICTQPPYVMERWKTAGSDPDPLVECVLCYEVCSEGNFAVCCFPLTDSSLLLCQGEVKKPRCTKHVHTVLLQAGGTVHQKSVQLTLKHSAGLRIGNVSEPDRQGMALPSPPPEPVRASGIAFAFVLLN